MKLKQLRIQNCKAIEDLTIDFERPLTLIVGENGVGKTSVLKAAHRSTLSLIGFKTELTLSVGFSENDYRFDSDTVLTNSIVEYDNIELSVSQKFTKRTRGLNGSVDENKRIINEVKSRLIQPNTWPLVVFYDQKRSHFRKQNQLSSSLEHKEAYRTDHSIISIFEKWFDDRSAEEGRNVIKSNNLNYRDPPLEAVRKAVKSATNFSNISFAKEPSEGIYVEKGKSKFLFDQLSSGEKTMLYLVGDIARRCGILNSSNPLEVDGLVFIDEVDLHLHPVWQREIISVLQRTFPNIQFIISTHSPQVIGEVEASDIRVLTQKNGKVSCERVSVDTIGRDSNFILDSVMKGSHRNLNLKKLLSTLSEQIANNEIKKAQETISSISEKYGSNLTELIIPKRQIHRRKNLQ